MFVIAFGLVVWFCLLLVVACWFVLVGCVCVCVSLVADWLVLPGFVWLWLCGFVWLGSGVGYVVRFVWFVVW